MNTYQQHLFKQLQEMSISEPGAVFTFERRLARENGWDENYASRVMDEYHRFILLARTTGHPVTPSDQVDQVWHLHLLYTRSYWGDLCERILGRPLHHGPTKGGQEESGKYQDWYRQTKESYLKVFGEPPPEDIWPPASVRFGQDLTFRRVNMARNYVVSKSAMRAYIVAGLTVWLAWRFV